MKSLGTVKGYLTYEKAIFKIIVIVIMIVIMDWLVIWFEMAILKSEEVNEFFSREVVDYVF
jgi:hypothetical protein